MKRPKRLKKNEGLELRLRKGLVLSTWTLTRVTRKRPGGAMPAGRLCILDYLTLLPSADDPLGTMPARRLRILDTLSAAQARRPLLPSMPAGRLCIPDVGNVLSMPAKGFVLSTSEPWERLCIPDISASSKTVPRS